VDAVHATRAQGLRAEIAELRDGLDQIEKDIDSGDASERSLVQLFNVAYEAQQQRDTEGLRLASALARRLAAVLPTGLAADAIRLLDFCNELRMGVEAAKTS
jgi:hypothetical protein